MLIRPEIDNPDSFPPKDGLYVAAYLKPGFQTTYIWWDATRNESGGYVDLKKNNVLVEYIDSWEKRVPNASNFGIVNALNKHKK